MSLTYTHIHDPSIKPEKYSGPEDIVNLVSEKDDDLQNNTRLAMTEAEKLKQLFDLNWNQMDDNMITIMAEVDPEGMEKDMSRQSVLSPTDSMDPKTKDPSQPDSEPSKDFPLLAGNIGQEALEDLERKKTLNLID